MTNGIQVQWSNTEITEANVSIWLCEKKGDICQPLLGDIIDFNGCRSTCKGICSIGVVGSTAMFGIDIGLRTRDAR